MSIINWLEYWKHSLADGGRLNVDFKKRNFIEVDHPNLKVGHLPLDKARALFEREEVKVNRGLGIVNRDNVDWKSLHEVELLICPIVLNPVPEYKEFLKAKDAIYPYWLPAVVNREGHLSVPPENWLPVIARNLLSVAEFAAGDFTFSTVELVDQVATLVQEGYDDWRAYWEYHKKSFHFLTNQKLENYAVEHYATLDRCLAFVSDDNQQPAVHIIGLYEYLTNNREDMAPLLRQLIEGTKRADQRPLSENQYLQVNARHLGQMSDKFSLSNTQRQSLFTILADEEEKIFAVNGPPGTGKTTLLQSVVANEFVKAAINGKDAPLILACSTNNQAVTNIIESFGTSESQLSIGKRWLPEFEGFGTYLPSSGKKSEQLRGINYIQKDTCSYAFMYDPDYLKKAEQNFLNQFTQHYTIESSILQNCADGLRKLIVKKQNILKETAGKWETYAKDRNQLKREFYSVESIHSYFNSGEPNAAKLVESRQHIIQLQQEVSRYYKEESFFRTIGCWLGIKSSLRNRASELRVVLQESPVSFEKVTLKEKSDLLDHLSNHLDLIKSLERSYTLWQEWSTANELKGNPDNKLFYDHLDTSVRHTCFWLAVHYWEARWLIKSKGGRINGKGRKDRITFWRQKAMLTPCFVSTFHMAPRNFSYFKKIGENDIGDNMWETPPLGEVIDLLIVDEAGQVSPEVGAATFSLAKRALVVGDVKQIEPVWNITPAIDKENILKHELQPVLGSPMLSSQGNLMSMAQQATGYVSGLENITERGLMLREHRRCFNEIVDYCNAVAYNGVLRPMRGQCGDQSLFDPMIHIHIDGQCLTKWQSRSNLEEAQAIAHWLSANKVDIENFYGKPVEEAIGIITPFTGQKFELTKQIKQTGFDTANMKIGTAHALQGAERSIILFSTVYTSEGTVGQMFFDRDNKPNMLNVAVSRAKDSFIVFGDKAILNPKVASPSGVLAKHLVYNE